MVNVPKERKTFCAGPKCRKHTVHKVTQYKAGKASGFAQGKVGAVYSLFRNPNALHLPIATNSPASRSRANSIPMQRRYDRKQRGYGGQSKPVFHKKVSIHTHATLWLC